MEVVYEKNSNPIIYTDSHCTSKINIGSVANGVRGRGPQLMMLGGVGPPKMMALVVCPLESRD